MQTHSSQGDCVNIPHMSAIPLEDLKSALTQSGLNAGLIFLNKRVPHRFTAVYRIDNGTLRNVAIVDKRGEVVPSNLLEVPMGDSFCQFALKDGVFRTDNSNNDDRLNGHPYKGVMNSYVGLPLTVYGEDLFGTFCHFDLDPLPLSDDEFGFLQRAVRALPPYVIA
jgi:GAF domain-containing protein